MLQSVVTAPKESDFMDFVQFAPQSELIEQRNLIAATLATKYAATRTPVSELLRDRQALLDQALCLS